MTSRTKWIAGGILAVLAIGGFVGYRIYTTQPSYLLAQGRTAVENGELARAERIAIQLESRGYIQPVHLLQGEIWVRRGRASLLDGAGGDSTTPGAAVAPGAGSAQEPDGATIRGGGGTRKRSPAQDAFRSALRELSQIHDDGALGLEGTILASECLVHLGEPRLAAEALNTILKRQPDLKEAHRWLAAIYMDLNSPYDAIEHLRRWAELDPTEGRPCRWMGFFYKDYNKPVDAVAAYQAAWQRQLTPAMRADVAREWAEVLMLAQADYQAALDVLAQCPAPYDEQPEVLTMKADCLRSLAQSAEATALVDRALQANPDLVSALVLRASIYLADGQRKEAIDLLERGVRLDPQNVQCRQHLMEAYRGAGDAARAEQQRQRLEEAKSIKDQLTKLHEQALANSWDDRVRTEIAKLCLRLGKKSEAMMWLKAALASNPGSAEARRLTSELEGGGLPSVPSSITRN